MIKSLVLKKPSSAGVTQVLGALRKYKEFDHHEMVIALTDKESGLKAYIAVHNSALGPANGGTRMKIYNSDKEALKDVLNLSKAMSYKSALAGLPFGGGKGVIVLHNEAYDKHSLLKAYAQKIDQLNGLFSTGTDVGLTDADTKTMSSYCKYILGASDIDRGGLTTSAAAALGTFYSIKASARFGYGTDSLKGKVIGVKGIGKLGGELVRLLYEDGATVLVADIDDSKVTAAQKAFPGIIPVDFRQIHKQEMNIYAPCALGNEFTAQTVKELVCDIVAGGANNQLADNKLGDELFTNNILYAPDYVVNAGGLIFVSDELEADGFKIERVLKRLKGIEDTLELIFERSLADNIPTHRVADHLAEERIRKAAK